MGSQTYLIYFVILHYLLGTANPANILAVLPVPLQSHQMVFRVLTQELVKRGHNVTIITAIPYYPKGQTPVNYTEIDVRQVMDRIYTRLMTKEIPDSSDIMSQFFIIFKISVLMTDLLLGMEVIQHMIRDAESTNFDLIFVEDCFKSTLIFSHIFKAPVITISSFGGTFETFEAVGAETHPLFYPLAVRQHFNGLSAWEKMSELYTHYQLKNAYNEQEMKDNEILKKYFGINAPTVHDLKKNIDMVFLNIYRIWDSNRPVPPNVVYLGGLHQNPKHDLPEELKRSLDSSSNGVIYVSFGTNVNSALLSPKKLDIFVRVFSKLPYDVYWKWNESLSGLTENIKVMKWFPQSDLLRHPKVKLFITQGGLQSTDEAIENGIPLIGMPMLWDQWYNVNKYIQLKIGLKLDINTMTEIDLKEAIENVINDESYKKNILKLRSVIRDQPDSSLERAIWWTEYVIRNRGAGYLRSPTANISWIEYYEVKLIVTIAIALNLVLVILLYMLYCVSKTFSRKVKTE